MSTTSELIVAANAVKTRNLVAEQITFPYEEVALFREQMKSRNHATNVTFYSTNIQKWYQEWFMAMDGQPLLTAAIKFIRPEVNDRERTVNRKTYQSAYAIWTNSDSALRAKVLQACQDNENAKNLVLRMNTENKPCIEILQRLLNDYAKTSSSHTQRLNAYLLSDNMDTSKSSTPGTSLIQAAEKIQGEIIDAGGECTDTYLRSVVLERAKRMEPLKLMMHAFSESFNALEMEMSYQQLRTRLMTADNEIMPSTTEEVQPKQTDGTTAEASFVAGPKKHSRCKTCKRYHKGECRLKARLEAHQASSPKRCDYCHKMGHLEEECWAKEKYEKRKDRSGDREDEREEREDDRSNYLDKPLRSRRDSTGDSGRDSGRRVVIFHERDDHKRRAHAADADDFDRDYEYHRRGNMFAAEANLLLFTEKKDLLDSGATDVFVTNTTRVENYRAHRESMTTAKSGSKLDIKGRGNLARGKLPVSVCDQRLTRNLVGLAPICDLGYVIQFTTFGATITDMIDKRRCIEFDRVGKLYPCDLQELADFIASRPAPPQRRAIPPIGGLHGKAKREYECKDLPRRRSARFVESAEEEIDEFDSDATLSDSTLLDGKA